MREQVPVLLGIVVSILSVLPAASGAETATGVLPLWVDAGQAGSIWIETSFPPSRTDASSEVTEASRYLVITVSVTAAEIEDWTRTAFDLKQQVVEARASSPQLKVGLDADQETVAQLLAHGLAPYIDAYLFRREPLVPAADATARAWWRTPAHEHDLLATLLQGSRYGAELVLLEGITVTAEQRQLLEAIQATGSAELVPQPVVSGIDQSRVHFFLDPDSGDYYLAVTAPDTWSAETRRIAFALGQALEARRLFPSPAPCQLAARGSHSELTLDGEHRFQLLELHSSAPETPRDRIVVDGEAIIDPYEIVVKNQAFQEQQAQKVASLDVTEVHDSLVQHPGAQPNRLTYRVIERRDQATDYIWTGWQLNGVEVPADKLWQGAIYDDQVLLDPLEVELNRTYEYSYLGEETVAGRRTWKIGFRPVAPGAYLAGTVWIDQELHCQHKLHARHVQPRPPIGARTVTFHYQWVEDNGEQFWTWTRAEESYIWTYLGRHAAVKTEIVRSHHRFNRADLDRELEPIYRSDARILRETADGPRWLVHRDLDPDIWAPEVDPFLLDRELGQEADAGISTESYGRVLANPGALSGIHRIGLLAARDTDWNDDDYLSPYYSYLNLGVGGTPYQLFVNASENGAVSVARPGILRPNWTLSASIGRLDYEDRELGGSREEQVTVSGGVLGLALAMPVHAYLSFTARLIRAQMIYDETPPLRLDQAFVLPVNHWETTCRLEMRYDRLGFSSELTAEYTSRDDWQPWGYGRSNGQELQQSWLRTSVRAGYYRQVMRDQSLGISLSWERGTGEDRFSRIRLNTAELSVGGYSSQIRYDEGIGVNLGYTGHLLHLFPLRLRLDGALIRPDRDRDDHEHLVGVQLSSTLHGPWRTDVMLGVSQGLSTSIEEVRDRSLTYFVIWSRRF